MKMSTDDSMIKNVKELLLVVEKIMLAHFSVKTYLEYIVQDGTQGTILCCT